MSKAFRPIVACIGLWIAIVCVPHTANAGGDIASYFSAYYRQEIVGRAYRGPLDFLRDAATAHARARQVLMQSKSRALTLDPGNGYLRIDDSLGTDQVLTMAIYRRADGGRLVVVGSSNCADACAFSVEVFTASAGRLRPVARDAVLPRVMPRQFIKPGHPVPKALASIVPRVNYEPARRGTALKLTPWYGYEVEEQMDRATRSAIRSLVLSWDRDRGRFALPRE